MNPDDDFTAECQRLIDESPAAPAKSSKPKGMAATAPVFKPDENRQDAIPYSHSAMIELIIANPTWDSRKLARHFGFTPGWFSQVIASDDFQQELDPRRHEVANPAMVATMEERFRGLTLQSLDKLQTMLENPKVQDTTVLKAAELGIKALGLGMKKGDDDDKPPEVRTLDTLANRLTEMLRQRSGNVLQSKSGIPEPLVLDQPMKEVPNGQ